MAIYLNKPIGIGIGVILGYFVFGSEEFKKFLLCMIMIIALKRLRKTKKEKEEET